MRPRSYRAAWKPSTIRVCVVLIGIDDNEVRCLCRSLERAERAQVIAYRHSRTLTANPPAGEVDMAVLSTPDRPEQVAGTLRRICRQWPGSLTVLVGREGGGALEQCARAFGAFFVLHPVSKEQWDALVEGARACRNARMSVT